MPSMESIDHDVVERLTFLVGKASACWTFGEPEVIFEDQKALDVVDELLTEVRKIVQQAIKIVEEEPTLYRGRSQQFGDGIDGLSVQNKLEQLLLSIPEEVKPGRNRSAHPDDNISGTGDEADRYHEAAQIGLSEAIEPDPEPEDLF